MTKTKFVVDWKLKFPTSTYSAYETKDRLFVGGSLWNRRKIMYTRKIALTSKGVLRILRKDGKKFIPEKEVVFPSMVYPIIPLSKNEIFIGLKLGKKTFNKIDLKGNLLKQNSDKLGNGIYGIVFDKSRKEIIIATRNGKLEFIDAQSLKIKKSIQVCSPKTRLWSLKFDKKNDIIYLGDYDGGFYVVNRKNLKKKAQKKLDLIDFYGDDSRKKSGFKPGLWGIEIINNQLVFGTRWGDLLFFDRNLKLKKKVNMKEDIAHLEKISSNEMLVSTRYGKLFCYDTKTHKKKKIFEIKPSLQKENAIWNILPLKKAYLAIFADGWVVKISKKRI